MNYSALITAHKAPGLLAHLAGDLSYRGIFPQLFWSELVDGDQVRIRLDFEADEKAVAILWAYWDQHLRVQSAVVTPTLASLVEEEADRLVVQAVD